MNKVILPVILAMTISGANANALWDLYAGGAIGVGGNVVWDGGDHLDTRGAQTYGAVVGFDFPLIRIEGEYGYINSDGVSAHTAMANGYLKMLTTLLVPYIGVGFGAAFGGDLDGGTDAYAAMLGVTFDTEILPLKFDIEGRALYLPNFTEIAGHQPDMLNYQARVKIRYVF